MTTGGDFSPSSAVPLAANLQSGTDGDHHCGSGLGEAEAEAEAGAKEERRQFDTPR